MGDQVFVDLNLVAATVNGSGSQSANLVLTRAVFAMGIPVAPKNLFPSNIEGLPTWFYLRANSKGYRAGRRRADLLVALDRATYAADIARLEPGGVMVYEEAFGAPDSDQEVPLHLYPVPFGKLAKESFPDPDLRKYLTNMLYVGVVAEILGIPDAALEQALTAAVPKQAQGVSRQPRCDCDRPRVLPYHISRRPTGSNFSHCRRQRDSFS